MNNDQVFYRLTIRFTNGETEKFIVREPLDAPRLSDNSRFAIVRVLIEQSGTIKQVLVVSLTDVSYIRTIRIEPKEMRHRGAGMVGALADESVGPEELASIEFI